MYPPSTLLWYNIRQDDCRSYQGWHTFPVSHRESIPQWNGTDKRANDKNKEDNSQSPGPSSGGSKVKSRVEIHVAEDKSQRKISSFLKSGPKKRAASLERDKSVETAPKRVATEEKDAVDENQNLHSVDPKDPENEGNKDEVNHVQESDIYGSGEDEDGENGLSGDRSDKEAGTSKTLVAKKLDNGKQAFDSKENSEDENESQSDIYGRGEDEDGENGLSGDRSDIEAGTSTTCVAKNLVIGNQAFDSKENSEDEEESQSEDGSEEEVAKLTVPSAVVVEVVVAENPRSGSQQTEQKEKPQTSHNYSTRPKRLLRNTQELYGSLKDVFESDYEVKNDDPQWTDDRRNNRILRYGERLKLRAGASTLPAVASTVSGKAGSEGVV